MGVLFFLVGFFFPLLFFLTKKVTKKSRKKELLRSFFRALAQVTELQVSSIIRSETFLQNVASLFNETLIKMLRLYFENTAGAASRLEFLWMKKYLKGRNEGAGSVL